MIYMHMYVKTYGTNERVTYTYTYLLH